jgi:hypothetical protein
MFKQSGSLYVHDLCLCATCVSSEAIKHHEPATDTGIEVCSLLQLKMHIFLRMSVLRHTAV